MSSHGICRLNVKHRASAVETLNARRVASNINVDPISPTNACCSTDVWNSQAQSTFASRLEWIRLLPAHAEIFFVFRLTRAYLLLCLSAKAEKITHLEKEKKKAENKF